MGQNCCEFFHTMRFLIQILRKYFSHPSLVMYSFTTPPIKLKLRHQIGGGQPPGSVQNELIANHLDESLWWAHQKHRAAIGSYLLHTFLQAQSTAAPLTSHGKRAQLSGAKTNFLSQTGMCSIFFILFYCAGSHTVGDALRRRVMAGRFSVFIKPDRQFSFFSGDILWVPSEYHMKKEKETLISTPSVAHGQELYGNSSLPSPLAPGSHYFLSWGLTQHIG